MQHEYLITTAMKTKEFRSKVFAQAWELVKETGKMFAVCLAKAWALYRLKKQMAKGVVRFAYEKADGSLRKAIGTLKDISYTSKGSGKPGSVKTFPYFDVEASSFRSFRISNLITVY